MTEPLTPEQMDEFIRERDRFAKMFALDYWRGPDLHDDLQQEARIGMWEAKRKRPDVADVYVRTAGRNKVNQGATREQWTGYSAPRGHPVDPIRRHDRDSLDYLEGVDHDVRLVAAEVLDRVMLAYHEGEIMHALADLPPKQREYVVLRFWGGYTDAEIAVMLDVQNQTLRGVWSKHIKPKLKASLGHLQTMVVDS